MPAEDAAETRAQKLAAARKKLKEYQKRNVGDGAQPLDSHSSSIAGGSSVSSNISEASDSELPTSGHEGTAADSQMSRTIDNTTVDSPAARTEEATVVPTAASFFQMPSQSATPPVDYPVPVDNVLATAPSMTTQPSVNAIQVLIAEKAMLTGELNKYRCICRERDMEAEELRTQLTSAMQRMEDLQQRSIAQQQSAEQLRNSNAELQHKLAQSHAREEDQAAHLEELKKLLNVMQERASAVEHQFKDKCNEVEMAQIRIRQLSDEANVNQDNRVETLTQTQFMYEQQIRDLQAMVQQLSQDKGQANSQYQSYVQHLNAEIGILSERNSELIDECAKCEERERQLIEHISGLEKEIQKNLSRQDQLRKENTTDTEAITQEYEKEIEKLKDKVNDFDIERHEFQLKIKSQEDRLSQLKTELQEKEHRLGELEEHLRDYAAEQPDTTKLLATMESDKLAASRALAQNVELKKQLDELEMRFVQLTNDKADLMNKLDAEEHASREIRSTYAEMEERLQSSDERFKFKDEEMIRLSHENMELSRKALVLQEQLSLVGKDEIGRKVNKVTAGADDRIHYDGQQEHDHNHSHNHHQNDSDHDVDEDHAHHGDHAGADSCHHLLSKEDTEKTHTHCQYDSTHGYADHHHHVHHNENDDTIHMPTSEAVEKLQQRFTKLMSQVADLTEEKHRLEHLVLQLQSETETIGEYITLYQTQRRMLKQREYEKAAQMQLLQTEREQMRGKIALLNNLVNSLSAELPQHRRIPDHLNAALAETVAVTVPSANDTATTTNNAPPSQESCDEVAINEKLNAAESQQILSKIQDIITEIKENTQQQMADLSPAQTVDHLNCCLGKFEVV